MNESRCLVMRKPNESCVNSVDSRHQELDDMKMQVERQISQYNRLKRARQQYQWVS
jgi:hypothetical protein